MASHVNSVKDIVYRVHVTVPAVVQKLRVLDHPVEAGIVGCPFPRLGVLVQDLLRPAAGPEFL